MPKPATDGAGIFPTEDSYDAGFDSLNETTDVETQHDISATSSGFGAEETSLQGPKQFISEAGEFDSYGESSSEKTELPTGEINGQPNEISHGNIKEAWWGAQKPTAFQDEPSSELEEVPGFETEAELILAESSDGAGLDTSMQRDDMPLSEPIKTAANHDDADMEPEVEPKSLAQHFETSVPSSSFRGATDFEHDQNALPSDSLEQQNLLTDEGIFSLHGKPHSLDNDEPSYHDQPLSVVSEITASLAGREADRSPLDGMETAINEPSGAVSDTGEEPISSHVSDPYHSLEPDPLTEADDFGGEKDLFTPELEEPGPTAYGFSLTKSEPEPEHGLSNTTSDKFAEDLYSTVSDSLEVGRPRAGAFDDDDSDTNESDHEGTNQLIAGVVSHQVADMDSADVTETTDLFSEHLTPADSNADTESQVFVTPLASADFDSHESIAHHRSLADDLSRAEDGGYAEDDENYEHRDGASSPYGLEEEPTTTVHGHDDLFDSDDQSDQFAGTESGSASEEDGGDYNSSIEEAQPLGLQAVTQPLDEETHEGEVSETSALSLEGMAMLSNNSLVQNYWADEVENDMDESLEPEMGRNTETQPTDTPATPERMSPPEPPHQEAPWSENKGLAASRHNPLRPQTPVRQQENDAASHVPELENFAPRDVTNIPWRARTGSTPQSMRSQSTLSSSPPSPIMHPALPGNAQEPAIRTSWSSNPNSHMFSGMGGDATGRPRNDSQLTDLYDPFQTDSSTKTSTLQNAAHWEQSELPGDVQDVPPEDVQEGDDHGHGRSNRAISSPNTLFQKMRSVFEQQPQATVPAAPAPGNVESRRAETPPYLSGVGAGGSGWSPGSRGSPARSRSVSGGLLFYAGSGRSRADSAWTSSSPKRRLLPDGYARNNSYDAEEDRDDVNERSGLLSDGRGSAAN